MRDLPRVLWTEQGLRGNQSAAAVQFVDFKLCKSLLESYHVKQCIQKSTPQTLLLLV